MPFVFANLFLLILDGEFESCKTQLVRAHVRVVVIVHVLVQHCDHLVKQQLYSRFDTF